MLPKQGRLNTWSQTQTDLYLQRRNKHIHDAEHGGGDEPILVRGQITSAMGAFGTVTVFHIAQAFTARGAMNKLSGHIVGTS